VGQTLPSSRACPESGLAQEADINGEPQHTGRFCCKSQKSNNHKNLAKLDLKTSPLLHRLSASLWRSVIDFGSINIVPHIAARKTHQRQAKLNSMWTYRHLPRAPGSLRDSDTGATTILRYELDTGFFERLDDRLNGPVLRS
jgi:hypothetical protein